MSGSAARLGGYQLDDPTLPAPDRVLTAARAWTGVRGELVEQAAVVVQGGAIAWVGPRSLLPEVYAGLPVEPHPEATILPGLIEVHAHLGGFAYESRPDVPDPARHDPAWHALGSVTVARQLASVGVTTVQSLGARHFADVALREAIDRGLVEGPRIVASGPQLTTTGGHAWATGGEVDSITDIRRRIRDHHKAGVDTIKVMATGGFGTAGSAPWNAQLSQEELDALVVEAHRLGKTTAAHAHGTQGIERAVRAGIDLVAHASFINAEGVTEFDPRLADALAEAGTFVDTCSPPSHPAVPGETATPRAKQLFDHGVRLVTGHDIGAVLPASGYLFGLRQLEESGIPVEDVLLAATSSAAAAVGLAGVTGVLRPGYAADLIVVAGDPLRDLAALGRLDEVVVRGHTFRRDPVPPYDPGERGAERSTGLRRPRSGLEAREDRVRRQARAATHPGA
ncbi:MAG TPA: amidohydrolase family protein [Cellulomonas sp.]